MTSDLGLRSELIEATPGEVAVVVADVTNHLPSPASFQVRVVGAASDWAGEPHLTEVLPPGGHTAIEIRVVLPLGFPTGQHLLGVESVPLNPDGTPSTDQQLRRVADLVVSVGSLTGLHAVLEPSNVTGRQTISLNRFNPRTYRRGLHHRRSRSGQAMVRLRNRSYEPVQVALSAVSPGDEVSVSFDQTSTVIQPGHTVGIRAKVRTRRPLWGRTKRRPFTVIAKSTGHQLYLEGSHSQAAWIRPGAVKGLGILTVFALWASTLALVYDRVIQDDGPVDETAEQASADGEGDGGSGDGGTGSGTSDGANGSGGEGSGGEVTDLSISAAPVEASGQVTAREPAGVRVRIRSVSLVDEISPDATIMSAPRGATTRGVKLLGRRGGVIHDRIVPAEVSTSTDDEGRWAVAGLSGPGFFEIRFSKPGYATKAYVVEMPEDGTPISLDTEMVAGDGALSGVVLGPEGALGDVDITVTDGTLTYATTTPTTGAVGSWTVDGLPTPGTYLITARRRGFATATELVRLTGGQTLNGVNISMVDGTGTITGMIRSSAGPLGDVTVTATDGEIERTTTSLTEGPVGTFSLPELPRPGVYTLTVSAEGWLTQTMEVQLLDDEKQVNLTMVSRTGIAYGRVTDTSGAPLGGVGITAVSEDHSYKNTSAPDGRFELVGLEPGSYVIEFDSFEHHTGSSLIAIGSGALREVNIQLAPRDTLEPPPNNSLTFSFSADGNITVTERTTKATASTGGGSSASFSNLPAGVRTFDITGVGFQPATVQFRMGLNGPFSTSVTLKPLVVADVRVRARIGEAPIVGATVTIRRVEPLGGCPLINPGPGCVVFVGTTDTNGQAFRLDSAGNPQPPELIDGTWVAVADIVGYDLGQQPFLTNYDASPQTTVSVLVDKLPELSLQIREPRHDPVNDTVSFHFVDGVTARLQGSGADGTPITMDFPAEANNTYTLTGIPPGQYRVELSKAGYRSTVYPESGFIQLNLNDEILHDPVMVPIPAGTTGQVVWDRDGTAVPVAGATVTITGTRSFTAGAIPTPISGTWTVSTNASGAFSFVGDDGPIFGAATITVTHPDFEPYDDDNNPATPVEADSNTDLGVLEVVPLPGTINQQVALNFGAGPNASPSQVRIEIVAAPPGSIHPVGTIIPPSTHNGFNLANFALPNTAPGDYRYRIYYQPTGAGDDRRFTSQTTGLIDLPPNRSIQAPNITLDAQASISGFVFEIPDPGANPNLERENLGGATVLLLDASDNPVAVTEGTNPVVLGPGQNTFGFVALDAGAYRVQVTRPGFTDYLLDPLNVGSSLSVGIGGAAGVQHYLRPLAQVNFTVSGARFGGGVITAPNNVTVTAVQDGIQGDVAWNANASRYEVTGLDAWDARGDVVITIAAPGFNTRTVTLSHDAGAQYDGLLWGEVRNLPDQVLEELPGQIVLTLSSTNASFDLSEATHQLSIEVRDEDGNLVQSRANFSRSGNVWTSGNLRPGNYQIRLNAHNHAPLELPSTTNWITVQGGEPTPVNAQLFFSRSSVDGTVSLEISGATITNFSGVTVELLDSNGDPLAPVRQATTDNQGRFSISDVEDGDYHLRATRPGFSSYETTTTFRVDPYEDSNSRVFNFATEVTAITLTATLHPVEVRVQSAVGANNYVVGASVQLVPDPQFNDNTAVATAADTTDSDGLAEFSQVRPGRYLIQVDSTNSTGRHLNAEQAFVLPFQDAAPARVPVTVAEGRISGSVTLADAAGTSLNGSTVSVYTIPAGGGPNVLFKTFTFSGLAAGTQTASYEMYVPAGNLEVVANGPVVTPPYVPASTTVSATSGESESVAALTIVRSAAVNIVVREVGTNNTITGATVTWTNDAGASGSATDAADGSTDGTITFSELAPGEYSFSLTSGTGYAAATVTGIDLAPGNNSQVAINTVATGSLRITLIGGQDAGNNYQVRLTPGSSGEANSLHNLTHTGTANRTITGVRTGTYSVVVCRGAIFDANGDCPPGAWHGVSTMPVHITRNTLSLLSITVTEVPAPPD